VNKIDLTGAKFNRLTVLNELGRGNNGGVIWRCLCRCGNFVNASSSNLQLGRTKSCGCLRADRARERGIAERRPKKRFHHSGGSIEDLEELLR
jgi:hypothetical protein